MLVETVDETVMVSEPPEVTVFVDVVLEARMQLQAPEICLLSTFLRIPHEAWGARGSRGIALLRAGTGSSDETGGQKAAVVLLAKVSTLQSQLGELSKSHVDVVVVSVDTVEVEPFTVVVSV